MTEPSEAAMRTLIVNDRDGKWYVRRVRVVEHDLDRDEKVYRCDRHLGGPFDSLTNVPEVAQALDRHAAAQKEEARAALALPPSEPGEEWQIVPREPTPDMRIQGGIAWSDALPNAETYVDCADACYKAMLATAPLLPAVSFSSS